MWLYLVQGIGFGFAAASQPGPFQTYLISQALTRGWQRTLPSALAPLVSDGPIILLCVLVLSQVPGWLQRVLYIAGGCFILYLAYGTFKAWRSFDANAPQPESPVTGLPKAALMNMLSPGPYIFWTLVTGPILVAGWREAPVNGLGFLAGFYIAMVGTLAGIILVFGAAARLGPKVNRALLGISSAALFCFGLFQLWKGLL
ncbi:MAG: lysine transporter LysE [Chloroflexi bacterium]|nr:lysine transporter LysE [Chloroflexota bacterium]MDL1941922.1 lysine transporter LysE [Chloroflexi bacterium CFX2]